MIVTIMIKITRARNSLLVIPAALFGAATILYTGLWIYSERRQVPVQLGFDNDYVEAEHSLLLTNIYKDSPAEKAELRAGDRILKVDGERFESDYSLNDIWARHKPGDTVELTIQRPHVPAPFSVKAVYRAAPSQARTLSEHLGRDIIDTYPLAFLVVGLAVLFLRLENPDAWLLALDFAGAIAVANWSGLARIPIDIQRKSTTIWLWIGWIQHLRLCRIRPGGQ